MLFVRSDTQYGLAGNCFLKLLMFSQTRMGLESEQMSSVQNQQMSSDPCI
jgi:hypothetical protein